MHILSAFSGRQSPNNTSLRSFTYFALLTYLLAFVTQFCNSDERIVEYITAMPRACKTHDVCACQHCSVHQKLHKKEHKSPKSTLQGEESNRPIIRCRRYGPTIVRNNHGCDDVHTGLSQRLLELPSCRRPGSDNFVIPSRYDRVTCNYLYVGLACIHRSRASINHMSQSLTCMHACNISNVRPHAHV